MEQFSNLEGKVRELETPASTLLYQYDSVAKTAIDSEKHHVGGREREGAYFCHAFSEEKRNDRVSIARTLFDSVVSYCFR